MRIPRFWAKGNVRIQAKERRSGRSIEIFCWGWSDASLSEAVEKGNARAKAVAEKAARGDLPDQYLYGDRDQPVREVALDEWKNDAGETWAAVTRNTYGCEVLNTAGIMFVDIDLLEPRAAPSLVRWIKRLLGKPEPPPAQAPQDAAIGALRAMVQKDPNCGIRVYRTRSGLRCLMTQDRVDPNSEVTLNAMAALGADPLYVKLCKAQRCFRARLTPKPWRCGMPPLRIRYPWPDEAAAAKVKSWCDEYSRKAQSYATCALIEHIGNPAMDPEMARVVEFHDKATRVGSNLELA